MIRRYVSNKKVLASWDSKAFAPKKPQSSNLVKNILQSHLSGVNLNS